MRSHWLILLTFLAITASASSILANRKEIQVTEQSHFSAEDSGVRKLVPIPAAVLTVLAQDKTVQSVLASENIEPANLPAEWFSASELRLSLGKLGKQRDLVVVGEPPVSGGSSALFWVFRATDQGHKLVLTAAAHDLIVKSTRCNGYLDIEVESMTAVKLSTSVYRFDGRKYSLYRQSSRDL